MSNVYELCRQEDDVPAFGGRGAALCTDCLRLWQFDGPDPVCGHCGGSICDCLSCLDVLFALERGEPTAFALGREFTHDLAGWSPEDGGFW